MSGALVAVYVFGSVARGERDELSDLDLLAVVEDGKGRVPSRQVLDTIPADLRDLEPSVSWYGRRRLETMFRDGELFGWHLHAETIPLMEREPFLSSLGRPAPYRGHVEDVASFSKVLSGIPGQVELAPENARYELGLVYVCLRNIAMAASDKLNGRPNFSRNSPFELAGVDALPMTPSEYATAMASRLSGQRGLDPPGSVDARLVLDVHSRIMPWVGTLLERLGEIV